MRCPNLRGPELRGHERLQQRGGGLLEYLPWIVTVPPLLATGSPRGYDYPLVMSEKFPMTPAGYASMKAQLKKLKDVDRPANSRAIEIARGHGDLSENADYSAAKEEQGLIEAKIRELEAKTAMAEVIDPTKLSGTRVSFGATVTIEDTDSGDTTTYVIVGEHEADIKRGRISIGAPVARALIGKELGDTVTVQSPKGKREFEVSKVEWLEVPPLEDEP
jgi:transcription elongation factor GreA